MTPAQWQREYRQRPEVAERIRAYRRTPEYRRRSRERARRDRQRPETRERHRADSRRLRAVDLDYRERERRRKLGPGGGAAFDKFWATQDGRCYLCGGGLTTAACLDHDHKCCPGKHGCDQCRRGLACHRCNRLIGQAGDDADLLRLIATNLDRANAGLRGVA